MQLNWNLCKRSFSSRYTFQRVSDSRLTGQIAWHKPFLKTRSRKNWNLIRVSPLSLKHDLMHSSTLNKKSIIRVELTKPTVLTKPGVACIFLLRVELFPGPRQSIHNCRLEDGRDWTTRVPDKQLSLLSAWRCPQPLLPGEVHSVVGCERSVMLKLVWQEASARIK